MVYDPRDEMNHFVMRVSDNLQEECDLAMLNDNMNISRLMVQDQQVEEARSKRKSRDVKRERSFHSGSSKGRFDNKDKPSVMSCHILVKVCVWKRRKGLELWREDCGEL